MRRIGWDLPDLDAATLAELAAARNACAADIVRMTSLAASGHPGGSLSALDLLLVLYAGMRHDPARPTDPARDRLLVSNGHISPGVYAVLAQHGYFPRAEALLGFRRAGTAFGGHIEPRVPGVEWATGNLGQGFSAAAGSALATKLRGAPAPRTWCLMGDGEQQKGQIAETRRFAVKFGLANLTAIVDWNRLQIGGATADIMPQDHAAEWAAAGWNVLDLDGHDMRAVYRACRAIQRGEVARPDRPTVVLARTVMGKGIPFIENDAAYHGSALKPDAAAKALALFGAENDLAIWKDRRARGTPPPTRVAPEAVHVAIDAGPPRDYAPDTAPDSRSAYGKVLEDLATRNNAAGAPPKVLAFTCDLMDSVKMGGFKKLAPHAFCESGIQEHTTASVAGRCSREGYLVFFSTFGVFGVDEVYNQLRLNDFNETSLKVVCTHVGLSVGEDGPTHQCIDYLALIGALPGFRCIVPADPNQTDRVIRYLATAPGNYFVALPRAKTAVVCDPDGRPRYAGDYRYTPGEADCIAPGDDAAICAIGPMVAHALEARTLLAARGLQAAVYNFASIEPFPADAVAAAARTGVIVTVEDHGVWGGLGTRVAERLTGHDVTLRKMGVRGYQTSGDWLDLYREAGLSPEHIARTVESAVRGRPSGEGGPAHPSVAAAAAR